ncbi:putative acyltransferase [Gynuella sunshinyii YC6258]|uniref:Putative acyltransferase n=2 Tax=Gynuella sunshinyii TaxID=1445505 RepID=A0A0C5VK13_9GAMM|nr:putative acyltransferase [Gynuella sunshinyii YC6258]
MLAELRARAMKDSLEAIGRYDEQRVRNRLLENFVVGDTYKVLMDQQLAGFYVIHLREDHLYLDHLYIDPAFQGHGLGHKILTDIQQQARSLNLPVRLGALRDSRANKFYRRHGFIQTHEDAFDIFYQWQ